MSVSCSVVLVATATFGKTEQLPASPLRCQWRSISLPCLAVRAVAVVQHSLSTVHGFLYLNPENEARILQSPERRECFAGLDILMIDEAIMANSVLVL